MNNRYFIMRHGESTANRKGLIVSSPDNALNDYGLTSRGAEQVMDAATNTRLNENIIIVSSDFLRARETAEIAHSILDVVTPIEFNTGLRERDFGDWDMTEHSNYEQVWQHDSNYPHQKQDDVELVSEVLSRGLAVIAQLELKYQLETILLIGHGDVLQILLAHCNGIEARFHRSLMSIKNAEIRSLPANISARQLSA